MDNSIVERGDLKEMGPLVGFEGYFSFCTSMDALAIAFLHGGHLFLPCITLGIRVPFF
jgi:hypothetical protein